MRFEKYRTNGRAEIVHAIGKRLVGRIAPARASTTLLNTTGQPALAVQARDLGAAGKLRM